MADKPLYRYSAKQRVDSARMFRGQRVRVTQRVGRDQERTVVGELVSVAWSPNGNSAELVVIRGEGDVLDTAISLATVARIEREG